MSKTLKNAIAVCACLALTAICFVAVQAGLLVRETRAELRVSHDELLILAQDSQKVIEHLDRTIQKINDDAIAANAAIRQSQVVETNLNQRITDTSQNLNAILIQSGLAADQFREASIQQKTYWNNISRDTDTFLKSINSGARGLDTNMNDLHALLGDQSLRHAFGQADGILTDTHAMTTDAKAAVHRYTQPPTEKEKILSTAKDIGGLTYLIVKIANLIP